MMHRFQAHHEIPDGFLTVLEQMPGTIVWKDVSQYLNLGCSTSTMTTVQRIGRMFHVCLQKLIAVVFYVQLA